MGNQLKTPFETKLTYLMPPKPKEKPEPNVTVPDGDSSAGREIFDQHCAACHSMEGGDDKNASAPSLGGVVGRKAGSTGFKYSGAMKNSGITWTEKHLFAFLKTPAKYVAGTRMSFAGLDNEQERANLIAYLKTGQVRRDLDGTTVCVFFVLSFCEHTSISCSNSSSPSIYILRCLHLIKV
eukprot:TRINITY_DN219_c0_g1_i3.p2 TRINITY_DN219_c0_g1~~TRINITY_DN219_c0_g1_i3.p2  ORF type:complete len:181 (-),score=35.56 TRINITY_DN219_c0_g1_i3:105-647(-)